jgi:WD40 repeat protein
MNRHVTSTALLALLVAWPAPAPTQDPKKFEWPPAPGQEPKKLATLKTKAGLIFGGLFFSPDGKTAITACYEEGKWPGTLDWPCKGVGIVFWDTQTWKEINLLKAPVDFPCDAVFSADGKALAFTAEGGRVIVWDTETKKEITSIKAKLKEGDGFRKYWYAALIAFSPDRKQLAVCYGNATLTSGPGPGGGDMPTVWDLKESPVEVDDHRLESREPWLRLVAHSGGKWIEGNPGWEAVFVEKRRLILSSAQSVYEPRGLFGPFGPGENGRFDTVYSHDGRVSADVEFEHWQGFGSAGNAPTERIVVERQGETGKSVLKHGANVNALAISPEGKRLASAGGGRVAVWDLTTMKEVGSFYPCYEKDTGVSHDVRLPMEFTPDGKVLFVDGALWDLSSLFKESPRK